LINAIKFYVSSSRNMIDKTMCKVLWRNISDFYVNLRVEVGKRPQDEVKYRKCSARLK
jgi:hypothetical protein